MSGCAENTVLCVRDCARTSINSWDSWFIFNLRKINTCYCMTYLAHGERQKRILLVWVSIFMYINNVTNVSLGCWFSSDTCNRVEIPLYDNVHVLSNIHTWASFFLRHLANISFMVPFWASTDSGSVPVWGARVRSHAVRRRLFVVLMTAAHISPNVFSLRMFLGYVQELFLIIHDNSIHTYYTSHWYIQLHLLFYISYSYYIFISSGLHGRLAALGSMCPIH